MDEPYEHAFGHAVKFVTDGALFRRGRIERDAHDERRRAASREPTRSSTVSRIVTA
jgi:hypothetical protein